MLLVDVDHLDYGQLRLVLHAQLHDGPPGLGVGRVARLARQVRPVKLLLHLQLDRGHVVLDLGVLDVLRLLDDVPLILLSFLGRITSDLYLRPGRVEPLDGGWRLPHPGLALDLDLAVLHDLHPLAVEDDGVLGPHLDRHLRRAGLDSRHPRHRAHLALEPGKESQ